MDLVCLVVLSVSLHLTSGFELETAVCSMNCQNVSRQMEHTNENIANLLKFPCSCSSSCTVYNDCCFDSPFRTTVTPSQKPYIMCPYLWGKGRFRAVAKCPSDWTFSNSCVSGIGTFPPVTSRTTGTTYANTHCAICNQDAGNLKIWDVVLRCCPENLDPNNSGERHFIYRKGHLWMKMPNRRKCLCKYYAQNNDTSFTDSLELRTCDRISEIAKCSSTWTGDAERKMCESFLDPIYIGDSVYRNRYCALCNYARFENGECQPEVVRRMLASDLNVTDVQLYCRDHDLKGCRHFFSSLANSKGQSYPYSKLLSIREHKCLPVPPKRCCGDETYDWKHKRCRKVKKHTRSALLMANAI